MKIVKSVKIVKIVHAADVHLDSPLRGLDRYEGAPVDKLRGATRRALENLVQLCLDEGAKLLLVAGDIFDGDWPDYNTGLFFVAQMARLRAAGVSVVLVRGNHDARSKLTHALPLPAGVFDLSHTEPETVRFEDLGVAVHGRGYPRGDVTENLAASYPRADGGAFNVGLLHTCVEGREGHAPYAPCSLDDLRGRGYDYWALGHVHAREVLATDPWIVFSGNLQGRHARETGAKGATVVTLNGGRVVAVDHRALDAVRWSRCSVDLRGAASADDALELVRCALAAAQSDADGRVLATRVVLEGATRAHEGLLRGGARFVQEVRALGVDAGAVWIEKVVFGTSPAGAPEALLDRDDPVGGLLRALRALGTDDQGLLALRPLLADLEKRLPPEFFAVPDGFAFDAPASYRAALEDVERRLLPELLGLRDGPLSERRESDEPS